MKENVSQVMVGVGRKKHLVLSVVLALAVITVIVVLFVWPGYILLRAPTDQVGLNPALTIKGDLTPIKVASLDKDATFWGYLTNAAEQQKIVTAHQEYTTTAATIRPDVVSYQKVGFDYGTKKVTAAIETGSEGAPNRDKTRCYDGRVYTKVGVAEAAWEDTTTIGTNPCTLTSIAPYLTEGITVSGLTDKQAGAFTTFLKGAHGLININSLVLAEHGGKKYLHYSVDIKPVHRDDVYRANSVLSDAFNSIGLSPDTHPYRYRGVPAEGSHLEYYVDSTAQLPVYSEVTFLPALNASGAPLPLVKNTTLRTTYQFGVATFDAATKNDSDLSVDW